MRLNRTYIDAGPLIAHVESRGGIGALTGDPSVRRAYQRAKQAGELTYTAADRLAIGLFKLPPELLWGPGLLGEEVAA